MIFLNTGIFHLLGLTSMVRNISGCCDQLYILLILQPYQAKKVIAIMSDTKKTCDLCGLDVETSGFTLKTKDGDKAFCCEGCKGIYHLLNDDLIPPESDQDKLFTNEFKTCLCKVCFKFSLVLPSLFFAKGNLSWIPFQRSARLIPINLLSSVYSIKNQRTNT